LARYLMATFTVQRAARPQPRCHFNANTNTTPGGRWLMEVFRAVCTSRLRSPT
jgi:hypothetical protein